ncbi:MAG: hypothetical protein JWM34_1598 [Ilumatobacteraceae bacterium]|nr:hypothetical protein [Ilumatobacteraceae bacterium]
MAVGAGSVTVVVVAVIGLLAARWSFHRPRTLHRSGIADAATMPISVIVPARNEAANLPILLASLAACRPAPTEVIVVDDDSCDGTADVARSFGATVVATAPLPDGWIGKSWACHTGSSAATQPTLVFLDADTRAAPEFFGALDRLHRARGGLTSVQPYHEAPTAAEQCSALFNVVSLMGCGAFALRPPTTVTLAFGPCLVTTARDYHAVGGHASVRGDIVEDIGLAERYAAAGLAVTCALGGDQLSFRMYPDGVSSLVEGWTKNIATGARRAPAGRSAVAAFWVVALCVVGSALVTGMIAAAAGHGLPIAAIVAWAAMAADLRRALRRIGSFHRWTSIAFVVPLALFLAVFVRSAVLSAARRPVRWRGRPIPTATRAR